MTEENEEKTATETMAPPAVQYKLCSVVRSRHNRTQRAALPVKPRRKQYVGNEMIRLAHGRPTIITGETLQKNLEEIKDKVANHVLEVRTMDDKLVDLETMEAIDTAAPAGETRPQFPLDSVANDKNFPGLNMPPAYPNDDLTPPEVLEPGQKPDLFEAAETVAREADEEAQTGEAAPEAKEEVSSDKASKTSGKKKNR